MLDQSIKSDSIFKARRPILQGLALESSANGVGDS